MFFTDLGSQCVHIDWQAGFANPKMSRCQSAMSNTNFSGNRPNDRVSGKVPGIASPPDHVPVTMVSFVIRDSSFVIPVAGANAVLAHQSLEVGTGDAYFLGCAGHIPIVSLEAGQGEFAFEFRNSLFSQGFL